MSYIGEQRFVVHSQVEAAFGIGVRTVIGPVIVLFLRLTGLCRKGPCTTITAGRARLVPTGSAAASPVGVALPRICVVHVGGGVTRGIFQRVRTLSP